MSEEYNNISSVFFAPVNLELLRELLQQEFPNAKVYIYTSGYDGAKTLYVRSDMVDFEGYPESVETEPNYLFNGYLAGSDAEVVANANHIFTLIKNRGVSVQYEVYDSSGEEIFSREYS